MSPENALDRVDSRETFVAFLAALIADLRSEKAENTATTAGGYRLRTRGWENLTLEHFLDGMHGWATDATGRPDKASWHEFAQLLLAGKSYE